MKITLITGTRPQIIKSAILINLLNEQDVVSFSFVHTGQHYDDNLFNVFINEFGLPKPFNLSLMDNDNYSFLNTVKRLQKLWEKKDDKPDLVMIPGDTDSAFAGALAAVQMNIPVAHIESGVREYDMTMAEERNRRMIDHTASLLFVPTITGWSNLCREKVLGRMSLVGDTNYDVFLQRKEIFLNRDDNIFDDYGVLTIHRAANVDTPGMLSWILQKVDESNKQFIFPVHPRTRKKINELTFKPKNIEFIEPVDYDRMMNLVSHAKIVVTDSGGLQKEAYFANTPCVTLRNATSWEETVEYGANILVGTKHIKDGIEEQYGKKLNNPDGDEVFGNGHASEKIVEVILERAVEIPK